MAIKDSFLLWTHVLVLIGGSVTPVLHLMTDEALSSLGLDLARKKSAKSCFSWLFSGSCQKTHSIDEGHVNEACHDDSL